MVKHTKVMGSTPSHCMKISFIVWMQCKLFLDLNINQMQEFIVFIHFLMHIYIFCFTHFFLVSIIVLIDQPFQILWAYLWLNARPGHFRNTHSSFGTCSAAATHAAGAAGHISGPLMRLQRALRSKCSFNVFLLPVYIKHQVQAKAP